MPARLANADLYEVRGTRQSSSLRPPPAPRCAILFWVCVLRVIENVQAFLISVFCSMRASSQTLTGAIEGGAGCAVTYTGNVVQA